MTETQNDIDYKETDNTLFEFRLFSGQKGKRFIFYKDSKGKKLIRDVDEIQFTDKGLFKEIQTGFSAFPYLEERYHDYFLDNEKNKLGFRQICSLISRERSFYSDFHRLHMNQHELQLFKDLPNFLMNYCSENGIRLTMRFDVEANFMADVDDLLDFETFQSLCKYLKDCEGKSEEISYEQIDEWVIKNVGKCLVELEFLKSKKML